MIRPAARRRVTAGLAAALLGACAHTPPASAPAPAPTVTTQIASAPAAPVGASVGSTPTLAMPSEWQHHNGEDYDDLFDRMRAGFVFDEVQEPAIDQQLAWFENNPEFLDRTFRRAERYLYHVVTEVEARGMPLEFALLPVVESAYEPFAYSPSRASGLWQFIPATGLRFGLKQDWWYDGRRDVIESTRAALDYLQQLHDQFDGDWLLAIAAYNVGEVTVARELDRNRALGLPLDFWHLTLPAETRAYVPRLLALKRLMAEPDRYDIHFAPLPNEPYFAVIDSKSQIDLKIAAKLAGTSYDEIVALNPGFNRWATDPEGPHRILVPIDAADGFEAALKTLAPGERMRFATHVVGPRETLPSIAKQYGTSVAVLVELNEIRGKRVRAGETLKIPAASGELPDKVLLAAARIDRPSTDAPAHSLRQSVYRVRAGDTLSAIARRQGVPVSTLARLNDLGPGETLTKGQRLVIKQRAVRGGEGERLAAGRRLTYTVRKGDTVYSISLKFQVSVTQLKSWNGLNQRHQIFAGQHLVMYVPPNRHEHEG